MSTRLLHRTTPISLSLVGGWGVLLGAIFLTPTLFFSANPGDDLTRNTVRLALLYYLPAAALMLHLDAPGWRAATDPGRVARLCWSLAWLAYLVHVAVAFRYAHHWSHEEAMRHVHRVSGFGPGIFASHLFTLVWTLDVLWWLLRPASYSRRPPWLGWTLHAFMAFIIFNATVVYESGFIRWSGVALFVVLGLCLWFRRPIMLEGETL
jgi:hypothetical protein